MKKTPFLLMLLMALSTFTFISCEEEEVKVDNSEKTVAAIAADDDRFSTLVDALSRVNLVDVLNGDGPFTVFAPTNDAFEALGVDLSTLSDEALSEILLYHVFVGDAIEAAEIPDGQTYLGTAATTGPNGTNLSLLVEPKGGNVVLNGRVNVTIADIVGKNGVIHAIDAVLMPLDVVGHAAANENFTELVGALGAASGDLTTVLSGDGPFTVFAPINSAFQAISETTATLSAEQLAGVLTYHVAAGNVLSTDLSDGMMVSTVNGESFTVNLGDTVTLTDARGNTVNVLLTNVQGTNGVIHVIDAVLLPETL
ncbi:MAG: fasciclin domain-containing protein [Bacteroidota bacterium]